MVPSVRTASPTKRRGCFLHYRSAAPLSRAARTPSSPRPVLRIRCASAGRRGVRKGSPKGDNHSLYVLDEPTIGLHMADVVKRIEILQDRKSVV